MGKKIKPLLATVFISVISVFCLLIALSWYTNKKLTDATDWIAHTLEVLTTLEQINSHLAQAESAQRGYFIQATPKFLIEREHSLDEARSGIVKIKQLTADNFIQKNRIDLLKELSLKKIIFDIEIQSDKDATSVTKYSYFKKNAILWEEIQDVIEKIKIEEIRLLAIRSADEKSSIWFARTSFILLIIFIAILFIFLMKRIYRDIGQQEKFFNTLQATCNELEGKVSVRTANLKESNMLLKLEIIEHKNSERKLHESQQLLDQLGSHQELIKEEERKRIAREIHDELGQRLLVLKIDVSLIQTTLSEHEKNAFFSEKINIVLNNIGTIMQSVRSIINDLRPAVLDLGLHAAIEWQLGQFQQRTGIQCVLLSSSREVDLTDSCATSLFRILQESLTNIRRHSMATRMEVELNAVDGSVLMTVTDNGDGSTSLMENTKNNNVFGLLGMKERINRLGGKINIITAPGRGFKVAVSIPTRVQITLYGPKLAIPADIKILLIELLDALDTDNPAPVEPILESLKQQVPASELAPIWACVRSFDFRGAETNTLQLASQHGILLN